MPPGLPPTKLQALETLFAALAAEAGTKAIVFSDHEASFSALSNSLRAHNVGTVALDGGTPEAVEAAVRAYKQDPATRVLFANSALFGCGLNLENTDRVIFVHAMEPRLYKQVVGRAQRPGRKAPLHITEVLYEHEVAGGGGRP